MADDGYVRVEIGLDGGQILSVLMSAKSAVELESALEGGAAGALPLDTQDGKIHLMLPRVLYAKRFAREPRVGFAE